MPFFPHRSMELYINVVVISDIWNHSGTKKYWTVLKTVEIIQFICVEVWIWVAKYFSCDRWSNFQVEAINFRIPREKHAKETINTKKPFQQKRRKFNGFWFKQSLWNGRFYHRYPRNFFSEIWKKKRFAGEGKKLSNTLSILFYSLRVTWVPVTGSFMCRYCIIQFTFNIDSSFMFFFCPLTHIFKVMHPLRPSDFFLYSASMWVCNWMSFIEYICVFHVYIQFRACFMCPLSWKCNQEVLQVHECSSTNTNTDSDTAVFAQPAKGIHTYAIKHFYLMLLCCLQFRILHTRGWVIFFIASQRLI